MLKRVIAAVAAVLLCASAQASTYEDGTYTGTGQGNVSQIQVEVVVTGGKVASVKVLKHGETEMLFNAAQKKLSKTIVKINMTPGSITLYDESGAQAHS